MSKIRQVLLYAGVAALALSAGLLVRSSFTDGGPRPEAAQAGAAETLLGASLPDLEDKNQPISQWRGKVLVVNFWATWCEPCRREIPEFIQLQEQFRDQGLLFVGIAVDQKAKVAAYSKEMGINYPVLVGGLETMSLAEAAGNRQAVLPYTVIIDRGGRISGTHMGRISKDDLEPMFRPLL